MKNNQPEQSITSNNQKKQSKISQSIIRSKQNITNKHEKLSHQLTAKSITRTATTNNPHNLSIKKTPKNKHKKQLRKNAMFLNIKISQTVATSEPTANTLLIKTQYNRKKTKQHNLHFEVTIQQAQKK